MKVSFNRLAEQELIAAARYLQQESGLGSALLDEYETWEAKITQFPSSCPEISPNIRCGFLKRFKYHVTYLVRGHTIRILYVRHARQERLKTWPRT
ncbi:MAG: type II toxin-antitoxin system RelE/ParE family toxin [Spirochaetaceae bacterium]|nr:type II toxin-antitoxin system RelE/ParE family toxin [Spirochaetaceae bacterium]